MKFSEESTDILIENLCLTDYVKVIKEISNLEQEIERLKKYVYRPKVKFSDVLKLREENERLNNIINKVIYYCLEEMRKLRKDLEIGSKE